MDLMQYRLKPLNIVNQMQKEIVKSGSGSYDATTATYAWKLTRDWLREHGV